MSMFAKMDTLGTAQLLQFHSASPESKWTTPTDFVRKGQNYHKKNMEGSSGFLLDVFGVEYMPTGTELARIDDLREKLKGLLLEDESLSFPVQDAICRICEDPRQLLSFLRGRKLNVTKAATSIHRYAEIRYQKYLELFPPQLPDFASLVFEHKIIGGLRHRDHLRRTIITFRIDQWDPSIVSFEQIVIAVRYLIEDAMEYMPDILRDGIVVVHDCKGASFGHAKQYTPVFMKKLIDVFWKAYPLPFKGIYLVHTPLYIRVLYSIVQPFLPKKLAERAHLMSGNHGLSKLISPNILPKYLGGLLEDSEAELSVDEIKRNLKFLQ